MKAEYYTRLRKSRTAIVTEKILGTLVGFLAWTFAVLTILTVIGVTPSIIVAVIITEISILFSTVPTASSAITGFLGGLFFEFLWIAYFLRK